MSISPKHSLNVFLHSSSRFDFMCKIIILLSSTSIYYIVCENTPFLKLIHKTEIVNIFYGSIMTKYLSRAVLEQKFRKKKEKFDDNGIISSVISLLLNFYGFPNTMGRNFFFVRFRISENIYKKWISWINACKSA